MRKLTQITLFQGTETQKQLHDFDRALQEALRADHLNVVRYLVEEMECQLPLVATWDRDETLLISLFQRGGRYALAAFVLAKQQDARQVSRYSGQPLLTMAVTRALAEGRARAPELDDFIRVLLQSGAGIDVNIEDADLSRRGGIVASKIAQYLNAIIETWPEFSALHLPDFLMLCGLTIGKIPFSQMPTKNTDIPLIFDDRSLRANRAAVMQCYDHYHAIFAGLAAAGEMSEETQAVLRGMQLLQLLSPGGLQARALAVCREL